MPVELLVSIAYGALALLIAVLAIYLALRLLGKIAKFVIFAVVVALVLWFIFSDQSVVKIAADLFGKLGIANEIWNV